MASRAATVVRAGDGTVDLRFAAPCAGCSGCAGRCRVFRWYQPDERPLTLPKHLCVQNVQVGQSVELKIDDSDLRRLVGRMYASTLIGLIGGAAMAGVLVGFMGLPADLPVFIGAVVGSCGGWFVARPGADLSLIKIQTNS